MPIKEIASDLQITKVIWIDDLFCKNNTALKKLLLENLNHFSSLEDPSLRALVETDVYKNAEEFPLVFENILTPIIEDFDSNKIESTFNDLIRALAAANEDHKDLNIETINFIASELDAVKVERLSFSAAWDALNNASLSDEGTLYLIDKDNKYDVHPEFQSGIDVIKLLVKNESKGMPVLFSHNFTPDQESQHEIKLIESVKDAARNSILPLAAMSKLQFNDVDNRKARLIAALKRITVRNLIGTLANSLKEEVDKGFEYAIYTLNEVPTAQLDKYLIKSATAEGISEAHVLERIISASMKASIKERLANELSQRKLQILRKIKLDKEAEEPNAKLRSFFESEVYENEELLNKTYSPIACGDIFEVITDDIAQRHKYILISPPCDTVLRGGEGKDLGRRNASIGFLVTIAPVEDSEITISSSPKSYRVQVKFLNKNWNVNFNCMASVNLSILDWCSFNADGSLCHKASVDLTRYMLPGVEKRYKDSANLIKQYFQECEDTKSKISSTPDLLLSFARNEQWNKEFQLMHSKDLNCTKLNKISKATFIDAEKKISFPLKRVGRLKSPYAESILRRLSETLSRSVYELHYMETKVQ